MAYRCADGCGKLCGVEQVDPEISGEEVDDESGQVTGQVRIALQSTCCGMEIDGAEEEADFEIDVEFSHNEKDEDGCTECDLTRGEHLPANFLDCDVTPHEFDWDLSGHSLKIDTIEAEPDDWYEGTGGIRFQKHFWGASITGTLSCEDCDATEEFSQDRAGSVPAGSLDQFSGGSFSRNARAKKRRQEAAKTAPQA